MERAEGGGQAAQLWVHAASVGESVAGSAVVREVRRRKPQETLYLTALTPGGRAVWRRHFPDLPVGTLPFDAPGPVERAVAAVGPERVLLFETELWPEWLLALQRRGARVAVANGRLTRRSLRAYERLGSLFRPLAQSLHAVAAQSESDAAAWVRLGVPAERVRATGNTKLDALALVEPGEGEAARRAARREVGLPEEGFVVTAGSLRPGEERWLEAALPSGDDAFRLLVVPRHPERWRGRTRLERHPACHWLGRLGVLEVAYRAADVAIVGGTLEAYGGHNPAEPAALGIPVLVGPHTENCRDLADPLLTRGGAERVADPADLRHRLLAWRQRPEVRQEAGRQARAAVVALQGASRRSVDWLEARGFWA